MRYRPFCNRGSYKAIDAWGDDYAPDKAVNVSKIGGDSRCPGFYGSSVSGEGRGFSMRAEEGGQNTDQYSTPESQNKLVLSTTLQ